MESPSTSSQIITDLTQALSQLGQGSIPQPLKPSSETQYQELTKSFNQTLEFVQQQEQQIQTMIELDHYRIAGLLDSLTSGVALYNNQQEIIIANLALRHLMKVDTKKPVTIKQIISFLQTSNKQPGSLIAETSKGIWEKISFTQAISKVLQTGKPVRYPEIQVGSYYMEIFFIPVKDHQNINGGAIIFHDITHLIEVDQMKTEFVSVASHQLRTPLTSMRLFLEMLLDSEVGELNEQQRDYISNIQESTLRMIRLVNEFLNVSRIESGRLKIEPQITDLNIFVQEAIKDMQILAQDHQCKLTYYPPSQSLNPVPIDQPLMREILRNLITNALFYSPPEKGHVEVKLELITQAAEHSNPKIKELASVFSNSFIVISVKDNGMGIPEESKSQIFKKFYRADNAIKNRSEGSGLGLYLVKMIMDSVRGKVWFESQEGQGTTFYLALATFGMLPKEGEKSLA